jgi:hypothetical protein
MLTDARYQQREPSDPNSAFAKGTQQSLMDYTRIITREGLMRQPR